MWGANWERGKKNSRIQHFIADLTAELDSQDQLLTKKGALPINECHMQRPEDKIKEYRFNQINIKI